MKKVLLLAMSCMVFNGCRIQKSVNNSTISSLNLERYLGEWYEIARFDHSFERGMIKTKAFYALREDGKIDVINSGIKNGKEKISKGKAKTTEKPALLKVSFFGPFYSDYRVMFLDAEYQYALVGSSSDKYLWILARQPELTSEIKISILTEATRRGYDVSKLIWVEQ